MYGEVVGVDKDVASSCKKNKNKNNVWHELTLSELVNSTACRVWNRTWRVRFMVRIMLNRDTESKPTIMTFIHCGMGCPVLWNNQSINQSVHLFFCHSLAHWIHFILLSLSHSLTHSINQSIYSFVTHSLTQSISPFILLSLTHSVIHSLTHSINQSVHLFFCHSLTHSLNQSIYSVVCK